MFKKIAIVLVVLIASLLVFAATRPDAFRVERSAAMKAPPGKIFALINDFHAWGSWSPYEKLDPEMKRVYSGPASGKGAVYEWQGNSKAGSGRMEITDVSPDARITIQLDFTEPFKCSHIAEFTMDAAGDSTKVTWAMHGGQPYLAKVIGIFCSMDSMIGESFETGLANLKTITEAQPSARPATLEKNGTGG